MWSDDLDFIADDDDVIDDNFDPIDEIFVRWRAVNANVKKEENKMKNYVIVNSARKEDCHMYIHEEEFLEAAEKFGYEVRKKQRAAKGIVVYRNGTAFYQFTVHKYTKKEFKEQYPNSHFIMLIPETVEWVLE